MIQTPLGIIEIKKDGKETDCVIRAVKNDRQCPELDGRFAILVDYMPDGQAHTISCSIKRCRGSKNDFVEHAERAEIKSFCRRSTKLSMGMFSDTPEEWGMPSEALMDHQAEMLKNGMQYHIRPDAKRGVYPFGIAWLENFSEKNEVQTWRGSDPTIWWNAVCCEESFLFCCVKQEIDKWDPYAFFPDAPSDEYDGESRKIARRLASDSAAGLIAEIIAEVFSASFGADEGFEADECGEIAEKIKHRIAKYKGGQKNQE